MRNTTRQLRLCALAAMAAGALFSASSAMAASGMTSAAEAKYRQDRANCKAGQTAEDYATCMREAGAALDENRRGHLFTNDQAQLQANAMSRCDALKGADRDACVARMQGQGEVSGSVAGGGLLRELVQVVPADQ